MPPARTVGIAGTASVLCAHTGSSTWGGWNFDVLTATTPIGVASGGTGQATANAALNALLPSQSGVTSGWVLSTNGTNTAWAAPSSSSSSSSSGGSSSGGSSGGTMVLLQSALPFALVPNGYMDANGGLVIGQQPPSGATVYFSSNTAGAGITMTFNAATLAGTSAGDVGRVLTIYDTGSSTYKTAIITTYSSSTVATVTSQQYTDDYMYRRHAMPDHCFVAERTSIYRDERRGVRIGYIQRALADDLRKSLCLLSCQ